ncbi:hypothetical protein [Kutzneria sp. 744]|uniref:hypothetical protein n=1 Tax=Kutzneria sp. (strain 744) TaxID=345341 RepID=UPI0003EEB2A4|nr:hypothetical protein [Kutzneria sp. 744]EWM12030.1 hypothetical protein KUTG_02334 [Kutzneria sp. 744]EWM12034.1 hypothetical protein KUTG_02338 [Kutzneria sp. 744]EWM17811.1 hypothetical protein KUTG_08115 [Kutzneria sp. 744]
MTPRTRAQCGDTPLADSKCVRCDRYSQPAVRWEGPVCRPCIKRATRNRGCCPHCGNHRLLPGRDDTGHPICRDCAGIARSFFCRRCHHEGLLVSDKLCERCTLTDRLTTVLDDGTGQPRAELLPLLDKLRLTDTPHSGLTWLDKPGTADLLTALATGATAISHDALAAHPAWRKATYLRELLIVCGILPPIDKQLMLFQRWLDTQLDAVADAEHRALLQRFATWNELRRLRHKAEQAPLSPATIRGSRERVRQAAALLNWLDISGHTLATCPQPALDTWLATNPQTRKPATAFLRWAGQATLMPRRRLTRAPLPAATIQPRRQQHELINALVTSDEWPLRERLIALLVLLYAQPLSRITRLRRTDISIIGPDVFIRLGDPPAPLPPPLDDMTRQLLEHRNTYRGPNANTDWLFPGKRPEQPINSKTLNNRFSKLGIPIQLGRTTGLRELLHTTPSPVVASMLGIHPGTTARIAAEEGITWSRYASRRPTQNGRHDTRIHDS